MEGWLIWGNRNKDKFYLLYFYVTQIYYNPRENPLALLPSFLLLCHFHSKNIPFILEASQTLFPLEDVGVPLFAVVDLSIPDAYLLVHC